MTPSESKIHRASFSGTGITCPQTGRNDLALSWLHYLKETAAAFQTAGKSLPPAMQAAHALAAQAASAAVKKDPAKILACFTSPAVGTALHCSQYRENFPAFQDNIQIRLYEATPNLLLELAASGLLEKKIVWPHGTPRIGSPRLGYHLSAPPDTEGWRFENGRVSALRDGKSIGTAHLKKLDAPSPIRVETHFSDIGHVTRFSAVDPNPIAAFEEHPDKAGSAATLGGKTEEEWIASLTRTVELLKKFAPEWIEEMRSLLQVIIPVGYYEEKHLSASYREAIGVIYMTLHSNDLVMATALIHEFQHNKLYTAAYTDEMLHNAYHPLYKSPVRPDPRPLWGILMAVHAFLPVAVILRRMRGAHEDIPQQETLEWMMGDYDLKNHEGIEMLRQNADWTPMGKELFDTLDAIDKKHMAERKKLGRPTQPKHVHEG